jgi:hypothetical protein
MNQTSDEMTAKFNRTKAALTHSLSKGEAHEETVRQFFRRHLPNSLGVTSGQVIDSLGASSRQMDVIIYDAQRTPILYTSDEGDKQLVPSEGVVAVVEVKSRIEASDMSDVNRNMRSIKDLDKSAYMPQTGPVINEVTMYGIKRDYFPTLYFLFAYDSGRLDTLPGALSDAMGPSPVDKRIDMVCVLSKGVLINYSSKPSVTATPGPGTQLVSYETKNALLMFYMLTSLHLLQTATRPIAINKYLPSDFVL